MNLGKMLILPKKGTILHLMVRGSKPIVEVLERVEHNTLSFFLMLVKNESIEQVGRKKVDVILWRNKMGGRLPRVYDRKTSIKKKSRSIDEINLQSYCDARSYSSFCRSITPKYGSIDSKQNCDTTMMEGHTPQIVIAWHKT